MKHTTAGTCRLDVKHYWSLSALTPGSSLPTGGERHCPKSTPTLEQLQAGAAAGADVADLVLGPKLRRAGGRVTTACQ